jgi:hypothetical protein
VCRGEGLPPAPRAAAAQELYRKTVLNRTLHGFADLAQAWLLARLRRDRGVEKWFRFSMFMIMSKSILFKGPNLFKFKCKTTFYNSNKSQTETITFQNLCVKCSTLRGVRLSRTVLLFIRSLLRSGWGFKVCAPKRHRKKCANFQ